jgi:hypothetical protein
MKDHAAASRILYRDVQPGYQYVTAEFSGVYPRDTGLKSWLRTYVAMTEGIVVVRDEVVVDRPVRVESLIHLAERPQSLPDGVLCLDPESGYTLYPRMPDGWELHTGSYEIPVEERKSRGATVAGFLVRQRGEVRDTATILNIYAPGRSGCRGATVAIADGRGVVVSGVDRRQYRIDFARRLVRMLP